MSGGLWLKMVENRLLTVGALLTAVAMETCSSLSKGLKMKEDVKTKKRKRSEKGHQQHRQWWGWLAVLED